MAISFPYYSTSRTWCSTTATASSRALSRRGPAASTACTARARSRKPPRSPRSSSPRPPPSRTSRSVPDAREVGERITYLIASYNRGRFVAACLESVRRQTDANWLAIVVDDASTDESLSAIRPFVDERIRLVVHPRNIGYIATLKRLIAEASTDIVAILDADDAIT